MVAIVTEMWCYFFEFKFSLTPPNNQISILKIIRQTADPIKIPPLFFRYSLSQST